MKKNLFKTTISAFAMIGLCTAGVAFADNDVERAGARTGAAVDRTGARMEAGAERAGQKTSNAANRAGDRLGDAADRTGDKADRAGDKMEGSAKRAGNKMEGTAARADVDADEAGDKTGVAAEVSDTWITTKVKSSFIGEESLDGADISVDTEQEGVVTLTGTVRNKSAKKHAERLAKNVEGVRKVNNELKVVSTRAVSGRDSK